MNFQEKLKEIRELAGLDENVKSILKQMTGKELVSYEGIDALVAALMTFYNGELKKKATTNHTHSKEQIEEFPVFGTGANEMLEGVKLAETLGIPYGGSLNNSNTKTEGTAYYDSTTKKTYKCTVTNTLNYADASKYEAISNNDLLAKFQNLDTLYKIKKIFSGKTQQTINLGDLTGITTLLIQVQANDFSRLYMLEVNSTTNLINDVIGSSFAINLELKENKIVWNYNYADNSYILSVYGIRA